MLMYLKWKRILASVLALVAFVLANGCDRFNSDSRYLKSLLGNRQGLKVATVSGPFTYQKISGERQGLESDLLQNFARQTAGGHAPLDNRHRLHQAVSPTKGTGAASTNPCARNFST